MLNQKSIDDFRVKAKETYDKTIAAIVVLETMVQEAETLAEGREHLTQSGLFRSDKYDWSKDNFLPVKISDPMGWPMLRAYADVRVEVDAEFSNDLHEALDIVGAPRHEQQEDLQVQCEKLDQKYSALITIMHLVESGSCILPCSCGCEGCLNDRRTVREAIGDWRKILDEIDQGDNKLLHAEAAKVITENEKLRECNAILQHYADTTEGLWATDREDMIIGDCFTKLEHPLPPEMREEKSS